MSETTYYQRNRDVILFFISFYSPFYSILLHIYTLLKIFADSIFYLL